LMTSSSSSIPSPGVVGSSIQPFSIFNPVFCAIDRCGSFFAVSRIEKFGTELLNSRNPFRLVFSALSTRDDPLTLELVTG